MREAIVLVIHVIEAASEMQGAESGQAKKNAFQIRVYNQNCNVNSKAGWTNERLSIGNEVYWTTCLQSNLSRRRVETIKASSND